MLYNTIYKKKKTDVHSVHYHNYNGEKVGVFSSYPLIISEINLLGIETKGASIKEIQNKVSQLSLDNYMKLNFEGDADYLTLKKNQIKYNVLLHHLKELNYWLYDYNPNKMPKDLGFDYTLTK
jgi:hypothetical protein